MHRGIALTGRRLGTPGRWTRAQHTLETATGTASGPDAGAHPRVGRLNYPDRWLLTCCVGAYVGRATRSVNGAGTAGGADGATHRQLPGPRQRRADGALRAPDHAACDPQMRL